jgi:mono/diheme cytochrome c family protein
MAGAITATVGWRPFLGPKARALTDRRFERTPERMARGKYLVESVNGCVYCHAELDWKAPGFPVKAGTEGSGRSWAEEGLPWLTAPNITSDPETGGGKWSDDAYARAIREGIGHDGRALFPLMPYGNYRKMSDEDLASVIVYVRSLPPVRKALPRPEVPFPLNRLINAAPAPIDGPVAAPDPGDVRKRGEYLVTQGACSECHTPQDKGRPVPGLAFAGGFALQGPYGRVAGANITPDATGIPYYDEALFVEMIRTGMVKARKVHDQMPSVIYRGQTDEDLRAIFAYLQTLTPAKHTVDNTLPPTACARCGGRHGGGERNRTRSTSGPAAGAPALAAGGTRTIGIVGKCGLPPTA